MANHARLDADGVVIETADDAELAIHVEAIRAEFMPCPDNVEPRWTRSDAGAWVAPEPLPEPPEAAAPTTRMKPVGLFLASIPFDKLATIYAAKDSDPGVGAIMFVVGSLENIDMLDTHTGQMLGYLEAKGYITQAEQAAILAA